MVRTDYRIETIKTIKILYLLFTGFSRLSVRFNFNSKENKYYGEYYVDKYIDTIDKNI